MQATTNQTVPATSPVPSGAQPLAPASLPMPLDAEVLRQISGGADAPKGSW